MREKLDELARLHAAANLSELSSTHIINEGYTHLANLTTAPDKPCFVVMNRKEIMDWIAAIHNAFPAILEYVRELEGERDLMHAALSDIYYRSIPLGEDSGHSTISHIATDAMRGKNGNPLAARDAQQHREGVLEGLNMAGIILSVSDDPEVVIKQAAQRLREGK